MKFRKLKASEIECRIQQVKNKGMMLLLYKDARCDMNILDETVPNQAWKREHQELKGNIYCGVSIKVGNDWVTKWDAGAESFTEKVKGEASDSFKRACFNWGIGRELYTAPFIWINGKEDEIKPKGQGYTCYTKFSVSDIAYYKDTIKSLTIIDDKGNTRFTWGSPNFKTPEDRMKEAEQIMLQAQAEISKNNLPSKLKLECEDLELNRKVLRATLKAFNVTWDDLDLTVIQETTFIQEFRKQLKAKQKLMKEGI